MCVCAQEGIIILQDSFSNNIHRICPFIVLPSENDEKYSPQLLFFLLSRRSIDFSSPNGQSLRGCVCVWVSVGNHNSSRDIIFSEAGHHHRMLILPFSYSPTSSFRSLITVLTPSFRLSLYLDHWFCTPGESFSWD